MCGYSCRYDGVLCSDLAVSKLVRAGLAVPVCPELLGGLDVPRPPSEIQGGDGLSVLRGLARVVNSEGVDVTGAYLNGARTALLIGLQAGCSSAILKEGSPTCGAGAIHDGSFTHTAVAGDGVLAALLRQHGFNVRTEEDVNVLSL